MKLNPVSSSQRPETVRKKILQLENRQKILLNRKANAERKARTHRLIERGAILESVFPEIVPMTSVQVKGFCKLFDILTGTRDSRQSQRAHLYTLRVPCALRAIAP